MKYLEPIIDHWQHLKGFLGPLIFLLHINNLPQHFKHSRVDLFADDTPILIIEVNHVELSEKVNLVIKEFVEWSKFNHLLS